MRKEISSILGSLESGKTMNGSIFENGKKNDSGKNFQDHNSQISLVKKIFVLQVPCGLHSK